MRARPSILIAVIFGILPLLSCANPIIEEIYAKDKGQNKPQNDPEIVPADDPEIITVTGVSLDATGLTLAVSGTEILTAAVLPEDATNRTVIWVSTDDLVATVNDGLVTALGKGTATITVTTVNGGKTASCEVTVFVPVTGVSLDTRELNPLTSETETLTAEIEPENATIRAVTWASSDDLIAAVNDSGEITALAEGRATITVTTVDGNHSASCTVTVKERTGEADAPFLIRNEAELRKVGTGTDDWNLSAHYKLAADITLTQGDWTEIGNSVKTFTGSFDGNNKTITGLRINKPSDTHQGMFSSIGSGGVVKNLTLVDCDIYGDFIYVGGVAGQNRGTVLNSRVTGTVTGYWYVGGVVGENIPGGTVENCYTTGDISGNDYVGGIAGLNREGTITNSYATGFVRGKRSQGGAFGGVAGMNLGTVINCYATGDVSGKHEVGGVVGANTSGATVINCYATGNVEGNDYVGGVVGYNYVGATVENCVALNPNINSTGTLFGRIGNIKGTIANNYARIDMKLNNIEEIWTNNISDRDGEDITPADYNLQSWWSSCAGFDFGAAGAWEWDNAGRLPVLITLGLPLP